MQMVSDAAEGSSTANTAGTAISIGANSVATGVATTALGQAAQATKKWCSSCR